MSTNTNAGRMPAQDDRDDRDAWPAGTSARAVRPADQDVVVATNADRDHDHDGDGKKDLEKEAGAGMIAAGTVGAAVGTIAAGPVGGVIGAAIGGAAGTAAGKAIHEAREHQDDAPDASTRPPTNP